MKYRIKKQYEDLKVPQLAWYNPRDLELAMPDDWRVEMPYMSGCNHPEVKPEAILEALRKPIGTKPLGELAQEGKRSSNCL